MLLWKRERESGCTSYREVMGMHFFFQFVTDFGEKKKKYEYAFDAGLCETSSGGGGWRRKSDAREEKQRTPFFFAL
jgi:hypothetical protein